MQQLLSIKTQHAFAAPMIKKVCIQGVVDQVTNASALATNITKKDTMTGHYVYDMSLPSTTSPGQNPDPSLYNSVGTYPFVTNPSRLFYEVNGFTFQTNPTNLDFGIVITDGIPGKHIDQILLASTDLGRPYDYNTPVIDHGLNTGIRIVEIGLYYNQKTPGSVISSSALNNVPTSNAQLGNWDTSWFIDGPSGGYIQGHLTDIHIC